MFDFQLLFVPARQSEWLFKGARQGPSKVADQLQRSRSNNETKKPLYIVGGSKNCSHSFTYYGHAVYLVACFFYEQNFSTNCAIRRRPPEACQWDCHCAYYVCIYRPMAHERLIDWRDCFFRITPVLFYAYFISSLPSSVWPFSYQTRTHVAKAWVSR